MEVIKKTKMVCTIGPKSENKEMMGKLVDAGMNVIRLNFSHGDHEEQFARVKTLREINAEKGTNVAILLDTKGPEIRTLLFEDGAVTLEEGKTVVVTTNQDESVLGNAERFAITYTGVVHDVKKGDTILLDDGAIGLTVESIDTTAGEVTCVVQNTGVIKNRKGVNLPGVILNLDFLSPKDRGDIEFACEHNLDYIAASFVRRPSDVLEVREILKAKGNDHIQIISKIESQEGVDNIDGIIEVSDGIMVARGDLGVEVPAADVPFIQKMIIRKCNEAGKVVITATQMLESMQKNPRPTRAEVSDVANAIMDGTDAIMLSGESAAGDYPEEAVKTMAMIARRTEEGLDYETILNKKAKYAGTNSTNSVAISSAYAAQNLGVAAICTPTTSGYTARVMSQLRPKAPILAVAEHDEIGRKLALNWGVHTVVGPKFTSIDHLLKETAISAKTANFAELNEQVVITAGSIGRSGTTNLMKIQDIRPEYFDAK